MNRNETLFRTLLALLILKFLIVLFFLITSGIGLSPDEAQYWAWSQDLSFGYYSKPPGIAWVIAFFTALFGNQMVAVRLGASLISALLALVTYFYSRKLSLSEASAFFAAALVAFSPLGWLASVYMTTDGPMTLFWSAATFSLLVSLHREEEIRPLQLGLFVGLGALFKWTCFLFWPVAGIYLLLRRKLSWLPFLKAGGISLFALLFPLIWNVENDFVTFRHVLGQVLGSPGAIQGAPRAPANPLDFFAAQMALASPLIFVFFLAGVCWGAVRWPKLAEREKGLLFFSGGVLLFYQIFSCFQKIQGNWAVFVFPTLFVFVALFTFDLFHRLRKWAVFGLCLGLVEVFLLFSIPYIQSSGWKEIRIPFRWNRFRETMGVAELGPLLEKAGFDPEKQFLLSDTYQMSSLLSFYNPSQVRALFINLYGRRQNQFDFWPGLKEEPKKEGLFLTLEELPKTGSQMKALQADLTLKLSLYFDEVEWVELVPLYESQGEPARAATLFKVSGFKGKLPATTHQY